MYTPALKALLLTARAVFIIPSDMSVRANGIDELRPPDPYSKHGCSKSTADQYIIDYARTFGLLAVRFRMKGWVVHFLNSRPRRPDDYALQFAIEALSDAFKFPEAVSRGFLKAWIRTAA